MSRETVSLTKTNWFRSTRPTLSHLRSLKYPWSPFTKDIKKSIFWFFVKGPVGPRTLIVRSPLRLIYIYYIYSLFLHFLHTLATFYSLKLENKKPLVHWYWFLKPVMIFLSICPRHGKCFNISINTVTLWKMIDSKKKIKVKKRAKKGNIYSHTFPPANCRPLIPNND